MKARGILFSFMAFLLILALLSLIDVLNEQRSSAKANTSLVFALGASNSKFENVFSDLVFLDKEPLAKIVDQRNLPFSYTVDTNSVIIIQELPLKQNVWNNYFDLVNAYKIFNQQADFDVFYEGLDVNISTIKNTVWGGTAADLNFLLLPQCLQYNVSSALLHSGFYASRSNDCTAFFDTSRIKKYSVSVRVKKTSLEDYNSITYSIAGFANPANPGFEFRFIDTNCSGCQVPSASKILTGYFDPSQQSWIRIRCIGSACKSRDINIFINNGIQAFHAGNNKVDVNFSLYFKNFIDSFYFTDFNVSVYNKDFNIIYSNR